MSKKGKVSETLPPDANQRSNTVVMVWNVAENHKVQYLSGLQQRLAIGQNMT